MCECHFKETERADKLQSDVKKRLNRAIGQLNGVKNMINDNRYCGDVLTQLAGRPPKFWFGFCCPVCRDTGKNNPSFTGGRRS